MTQPQPDAAQQGAKRYFALQASDDPAPYALAALNSDGMPERFVPGKGFVDWPALSGALLGFDPAEAREAREIDEAKAQALIAQNVGALPDSYVETMQGTPEGNSKAEPIDPDEFPQVSKAAPPEPATT